MPLYAHVTSGSVDQVGTPPATAYADGRWWDLRTLDLTKLATCGWIEAVEVARPADTPTQTSDMSWTVTGGKAVQTWTVRMKTPEEQQADSEQAARAKLLTDLRDGTAAIVTAKNAATADAGVAATAKTQAETLSGQVAARKTSVDASTPAATLAYITAMRAEISYLLAQVKVIVDAVALLQAWRKAVDDNAVITDNALLWLAKQTTGDVTAPESAPAAR